VIAVDVAGRALEEVLAVEVKGAWAEYLASTRGWTSFRYEEVEPWAWAKLQTRLRAIEARRKALL
jgi:hypothetical protein